MSADEAQDAQGRIPAILTDEQKDDRVQFLYGLYQERKLSYAEFMAASALYEDEDED